MIEIKNVTKIFDNGFKGLSNVSLDITDGEFVSTKVNYLSDNLLSYTF